MDRERRQSIANGNCDYGYSKFCNDKDSVGGDKSPTFSGGVGFIEHRVSKLDTLAGIAIKYGVEVADIKKMNGLVTDLQIFALKSVRIPLPGRHPPSPCLNGSETPGQSDTRRSPPSIAACDLFASFQSLKLETTPGKVPTTMSSLQGYYGLKPTEDKAATSESFETPMHGKAGSMYHINDGAFLKHTPVSSPPFGLGRKSKSVANGFLNENGQVADRLMVGESSDEKLGRRWQSTNEMPLKEDNTSGGAFSAITGKCLALRSKTGSRSSLGADAEVTGLKHTAASPLDSFAADGFSGVRKCSSTSNLQDQDSNSLSLIWPITKWNLKAELTRPIFDGLPKPATARKNKAALD